MDLLALLSNPETWIALLTLTVLEIVLGIDNVIFISILVTRLPTAQRDRARRVDVSHALTQRSAMSAWGGERGVGLPDRGRTDQADGGLTFRLGHSQDTTTRSRSRLMQRLPL